MKKPPDAAIVQFLKALLIPVLHFAGLVLSLFCGMALAAPFLLPPLMGFLARRLGLSPRLAFAAVMLVPLTVGAAAVYLGLPLDVTPIVGDSLNLNVPGVKLLPLIGVVWLAQAGLAAAGWALAKFTLPKGR